MSETTTTNDVRPPADTAELPAGFIALDTVLSVMREMAVLYEWCALAEDAAEDVPVVGPDGDTKLRFTFRGNPRSYCCSSCNDGMDEKEWLEATDGGERFTPVPGTPNVVRISDVVNAVRRAGMYHGVSVSAFRDRLGI